ncbi:hypothetical protein [Salegentibacter chungangensis]|uniref:CDP-glycerol--glycerophosphate glycerophosphotransferase n=1 Tax=Salegentibacter chungangensis TaxID=1335724 RepID=A0ABW3NP62_9FLAO
MKNNPNPRNKKKIAFLFLDEIHHLFHFISIAIELSKTNRVHILTYKGVDDLLYKSLGDLKGDKLVVEELPTFPFRSFTDKLKNRKLPRKGFWLKRNLNYLLNEFNAVVFTDYFHRYLLEARKNNSPKLLKFSHGTPGRAYAFNENLQDFDFQLLIGNYQYKQYKKLGILGKNYAITGYSKFDAVKHCPKRQIFKNKRTTVLYNPHFDPDFSSWQDEGLNILEFFYKQDTYNLIFAPHLHLFQKKKGGESKKVISEKYFSSDNIHIDLGSVASVNMTHVHNADIYMGDVSSQIYEFITTPRPCLFLNTKNFNYKKDISFRFWQCGPVIENSNNLKENLELAQRSFPDYKNIQQEITAQNYYTEEGSTPSERGAKAINKYLKKAGS